MKKLFLIAALCAVCPLFAQSADRITEILSSQSLTFGQAAYLSQASLGKEVSQSAAFEAMQSSGIIPQKYSENDAVSLKNLAWICANTWEVKGSLMFKATKAPRYAFRQLRNDGAILQTDDPDKIPSGREALNVITGCIDLYPSRNGGAE